VRGGNRRVEQVFQKGARGHGDGLHPETASRLAREGDVSAALLRICFAMAAKTGATCQDTGAIGASDRQGVVGCHPRWKVGGRITILSVPRSENLGSPSPRGKGACAHAAR
jgi:hypothetical protein